MRGNLHLKQSRSNYINNKKQLKRTQLTTGVDVVAKTDNQTYVLSTIKISSYFLFFLCCVNEGRVV